MYSANLVSNPLVVGLAVLGDEDIWKELGAEALPNLGSLKPRGSR